VNAIDDAGLNALHTAATASNLHGVAKLLGAGVSPLAGPLVGAVVLTPLRAAALANAVAAAQLLLDSEIFNAHENQSRAQEAANSALITAAHNGSAECLGAIMKHLVWRGQSQEARQRYEGNAVLGDNCRRHR
jgi:hypothetical protein